MRKMKNDFASAESCPNPKIRFKLETLMEDYQELEKEKEVRRRELEMLKHRRSILKAEVRFLRRRYEQLKRDQALRLSESGDLMILNTKRKKKQSGPGFDLNLKNAVNNEKEAVVSLSGDLGKKQKRRKGNVTEEVLGTPMSLPDLNQAVRTCNGDGKASTSSSKVPVFDLNEISEEAEESQGHGERTAAEDVKRTALGLGLGNEELQGEIKLSVCRNLKKGLNRAVKRKVSWQDPVALRV